MTHNQDHRAEAARQWACSTLGVSDAGWAPASADASFRRYFRLQSARGSAIVMDAPPAQEDCGPFLAVAARLQAAGLSVPPVLGQDLDRGFLLLGDLGTHTWLQGMPRAPEAALAWFATATAALVQAQRHIDPAGLPAYDAGLLRRELQLFPDWFVGRHLGRRFTAAESALWDTVCERLLANALAQRSALSFGKSAATVESELTAQGLDAAQRAAMAPHRVFPGNRPSSLLVMPRLDAFHLGALMAAYEHRTFVLSVLWGVLPFDQWGVELGKAIAKTIDRALATGTDGASLDAATAYWVERFRQTQA